MIKTIIIHLFYSITIDINYFFFMSSSFCFKTYYINDLFVSTLSFFISPPLSKNFYVNWVSIFLLSLTNIPILRQSYSWLTISFCIQIVLSSWFDAILNIYIYLLLINCINYRSGGKGRKTIYFKNPSYIITLLVLNR